MDFLTADDDAPTPIAYAPFLFVEPRTVTEVSAPSGGARQAAVAPLDSRGQRLDSRVGRRHNAE